jgi:hypothetical protein
MPIAESLFIAECGMPIAELFSSSDFLNPGSLPLTLAF